MKKLLMILIASALASSITLAESADGGKPGAFRYTLADARALGMGGAYTAVAAGSGSMLHNAAGLSTSRGNQINSIFRSLSLDRKVYGVEYCRPIPGDAGIGAMWMSAGAGEIMGYDYDGNPTEPLDNWQNLFIIGFGRPIVERYLSVGVTARIYWMRLSDVQGTGAGMSLGISSRPIGGLTVGVQAIDMFTKFRWEDIVANEKKEGEAVPAVFSAGAAYTLWERLTIAFDVEREQGEDNAIRHHFGGEFWLSDALALRAGADYLYPTAGASVIYPSGWGDFHFDYAFTTDPDMDGYGHNVNFGLDL
ncbi:MAG: hypothetical protein GY771_00930 [bacterium]|nr:hypothetical protein [bacterium]